MSSYEFHESHCGVGQLEPDESDGTAQVVSPHPQTTLRLPKAHDRQGRRPSPGETATCLGLKLLRPGQGSCFHRGRKFASTIEASTNYVACTLNFSCLRRHLFRVGLYVYIVYSVFSLT